MCLLIGFLMSLIDDVLSIINLNFDLHLAQIYSFQLEIKETTVRNTKIWSYGWDDQLRTTRYNKRAAVNFHIPKIPFLSSDIPSSSGVLWQSS